MGRGKVGDVVFYRMNGWQMARVRNRNPKNPRSNEQLYQRAVIATTMKAYSIGKEIFDHSFQGYTVGEGNMRRFNSVNARILRSELLNDVQQGIALEDQVGRFVAPRSVYPTPVIGLQVSEGTLENNLFTAKETNGSYLFYWAESNGVTLVNDYLDALNIQPGDIFTFVYMIADPNEKVYVAEWNKTPYCTQYATKFAWLRLIAKERPLAGAELDKAGLPDLFQIEGGGIPLKLGSSKIDPGLPIRINIGVPEAMGVMACIRSRNDVDLRSTEFTVPFGSTAFGITSSNILDVWIDDVQKIGESELILEGGDGQRTITSTSGSGGGTEGPSGQPAALSENEEPIINSPEQESVLRRRGRTRA